MLILKYIFQESEEGEVTLKLFFLAATASIIHQKVVYLSPNSQTNF